MPGGVNLGFRVHNGAMDTRTAAAICIVFLLAGCGQSAPPPTFDDPVPISLQALPKAEGPRLSVAPDGQLVLSWMQRLEQGGELVFSTFSDERWEPASSVVTDPDMFVNWADIPSVVPLGGDRWFAHWMSKRAPATYAYDVRISLSNDGGATWGEPFLAHDDGTETEHGFVSILPHTDGAQLIWLDGRKMANEATDDPLDTSMTLRTAMIRPDGTIQEGQEVDDMICECCRTDMASGSRGPVAVYRNRTADEIRNIFVTRFLDGAWTPGEDLSEDGWEIAGCPVNGPAIDADGDQVAIAWFTAANGQPLVRLKLSTDGGASFGETVVVAPQNAMGQVDVVILGPDAVAVSWVASGQRSGLNDITVAAVTMKGAIGTPEVIGRTAYIRSVPQMKRLEDRLVLVWTDENSDGSRLASAQVTIEPGVGGP